MSIQVQIRRGTNAQRQTMDGVGSNPAKPLAGELIYTTDTKDLYIGDGSTTGGNLVSGGSGTTNLSTTANGTSLTVNSDTGTNASIPAATTSAWGAMTDEDKTKLDGITAGATANAGTVTQVSTGTGLTGGPITSSGTISIDASGVDTTQLADEAVTSAKLALSLDFGSIV